MANCIIKNARVCSKEVPLRKEDELSGALGCIQQLKSARLSLRRLSPAVLVTPAPMQQHARQQGRAFIVACRTLNFYLHKCTNLNSKN